MGNKNLEGGLSLVPLQLSLSPVRGFAIGIEHALDVAVSRLAKRRKIYPRRSHAQ